MPICAPTLGYSHLTHATALGEIALCFLLSSNHRAPDRSPSQNPLPTPTWLRITFWLYPPQKILHRGDTDNVSEAREGIGFAFHLPLL